MTERINFKNITRTHAEGRGIRERKRFGGETDGEKGWGWSRGEDDGYIFFNGSWNDYMIISCVSVVAFPVLMLKI